MLLWLLLLARAAHGAVITTFSDAACTLAATPYTLFSDVCTTIGPYSAALAQCGGGSALLALFDDGLATLGSGATLSCSGSVAVLQPVALSASGCSAVLSAAGATLFYAQATDMTASPCTVAATTAQYALNVILYTGGASTSCASASNLRDSHLVVLPSACTTSALGYVSGSVAASSLSTRVYTTSTSCTSSSPAFAYAFTMALSTAQTSACTAGSSGGNSVAFATQALLALPYPPTALLAAAFCAAAPAPALAPTTSSLLCYNGMLDATASAASGLAATTAHYAMPTAVTGTSSYTAGGVVYTASALQTPAYGSDVLNAGGSFVCVAATVTLLGVQRRVYSGMLPSDYAVLLKGVASAQATGTPQTFTNILACGVSGCNSPTNDTCQPAFAAYYSTGACSSTAGSLPAQESNTATALAGYMATAVGLTGNAQSLPGSSGVACYYTTGGKGATGFFSASSYCFAATRRCSGSGSVAASDDCYGMPAGTLVRSYGVTSSSSPLLAASHLYPAPWGVNGGSSDASGGLHEVVQCAQVVGSCGAACGAIVPCNAPALDACANWTRYTTASPTGVPGTVSLGAVPSYTLPLSTTDAVASTAAAIAHSATLALRMHPGCGLATLMPGTLTSTTLGALYTFSGAFQGSLAGSVLSINGTTAGSALALGAGAAAVVRGVGVSAGTFAAAVNTGGTGTGGVGTYLLGAGAGQATASLPLFQGSASGAVNAGGTAASQGTLTLTFSTYGCAAGVLGKLTVASGFYTAFNTTLAAALGSAFSGAGVLVPATFTQSPSQTTSLSSSASPSVLPSPSASASLASFSPSSSGTLSASLAPSPSGARPTPSGALPSPTASTCPSATPTLLAGTGSALPTPSVAAPTPTAAAASSTPVTTPSASVSLTSSTTATGSPGSGGTASALRTGSSSASANASTTASASASACGTATASSSTTATATATGTLTASPTITPSPSPSPTFTPPNSPSITPSSSTSPRASGATPTPSPSATPITAPFISASIYLPLSPAQLAAAAAVVSATTATGNAPLAAPILTLTAQNAVAAAMASALQISPTSAVAPLGVALITLASGSSRAVRALQALPPTGLRLYFSVLPNAAAASPIIARLLPAGADPALTSTTAAALSSAQVVEMPNIKSAMAASPTLVLEVGAAALRAASAPFIADTIVPYSASPAPTPGTSSNSSAALTPGTSGAVAVGVIFLVSACTFIYFLRTRRIVWVTKRDPANPLGSNVEVRCIPNNHLLAHRQAQSPLTALTEAAGGGGAGSRRSPSSGVSAATTPPSAAAASPAGSGLPSMLGGAPGGPGVRAKVPSPSAAAAAADVAAGRGGGGSDGAIRYSIYEETYGPATSAPLQVRFPAPPNTLSPSRLGGGSNYTRSMSPGAAAAAAVRSERALIE